MIVVQIMFAFVLGYGAVVYHRDKPPPPVCYPYPIERPEPNRHQHYHLDDTRAIIPA